MFNPVHIAITIAVVAPFRAAVEAMSDYRWL
jgi:hypothetical protein